MENSTLDLPDPQDIYPPRLRKAKNIKKKQINKKAAKGQARKKSSGPFKNSAKRKDEKRKRGRPPSAKNARNVVPNQFICPFKCCPGSYTSVAWLRKHLQKKHKVDITDRTATILRQMSKKVVSLLRRAHEGSCKMYKLITSLHSIQVSYERQEKTNR